MLIEERCICRLHGLEAFRIEQDVDLIMITSEEHYHKPQPEIFRIALDHLRVQPERRSSLMMKRGILPRGRLWGCTLCSSGIRLK